MMKTERGKYSLTVFAICIALIATFVSFAHVVSASAAASDYVRIHESGTRIVGAPTVLTEIGSSEDLGLLGGENPPSTVLVRVNGSLQVIAADGSVIESLAEFAARVNKTSAIAVIADSVKSASDYADWCKTGNYRDFFVVSDSVDAIKGALSNYKYLLGILDLRGKSDVTTASACSQVMTAGARILLSTKGTFTCEANRRLKALQIASWTVAESEREVVSAMYEGYTGLLTSSPSVAYGVYEAYKEKTIYDTSVIVGHRGSSGTYPENSVEAALYAVEQGADAIEYDILLSKDNRVVIMHDTTIDTTTNCTSNGVVKEMTLAQIREYRLVGSNGSAAQIPTLDDMFEAFKDKNTVHYIEYKADDKTIIPYVKTLIKQYGMSGRVVFISFFAGVLAESRTQMPEIPIGQLYGNFGTRDYYDDLESTVTGFSALSKSNHCVYSNVSRQYIEVARHRGIGVNGWTFVGPDAYYRTFAIGMGSRTIDNPEKIGELPLRVRASDITAKVGEEFTPSGVAVTATKSYDANCTLVFIGEGADSFTVSDGKYTPTKAGEYKAVLLYNYARGGYSAASDMITVTVADSTASKDEGAGNPAGSEAGDGDTAADSSGKKKSGCGSQAGAGRLSAALICTAAAALALIKQKRKTE